MSEYKKLLLDPRWQKKRLQILERDGWKCRCGNDKETLHIHHCYYIWGRAPWEYEDQSLITLCASCHLAETEALPEAKEQLLIACGKMGFIYADYMILIEKLTGVNPNG